MLYIKAIKNALRDIRNVNRVSVVETALCARGYSFYVLELHPQIEAHVERHSAVSTDIIIESFVKQIERTKNQKRESS